MVRSAVMWLLNRVKGALNNWVEGLILAGALALAYLIWRGVKRQIRADVTVPTWAIALAIGFAVAVIVILAVRLRRRRGEIAELTGGVENIAEFAAQTEQARAMTAAYAGHLGEILYSLQRVLAGAIPGVDARDLIEEGVLQPARDLLGSRQTADVRLSVLVPDNGNFVMPYAAGHNLESKRRFRIPTEDSFSKWAFQMGLIYWSGNLAEDDRFVRHPRAAQERGYNSIISVPIRAGDEVVAVFNAIFVAPEAFDEADLIYVRLIGATIELVWQLAGLQGEGDRADS
jgi:GAF domain-containing protein